MPAPPPPAHPAAPPETLRERRKRELRQQLSDTATRMFLDHGFGAVRVADVARACGVTEATVFNHFPNKESLLVDRWCIITDEMRAQLAEPRAIALDATLHVILGELTFLTSSSSSAQPNAGVENLRRFRELVAATPSLVAHERAALDRLMATTATALADRTRTPPEDPEPWITAAALTGLWGVLYRSLHHHLATGDATELHDAVWQDVQRAAGLLRQGL